MIKRLKEMLKKSEIDEDKKELSLEKNDFLALVIAGTWVFLPVVLIIFLCVALLIIFMF